MKRVERAAGTEAALKDAARRVFAQKGYLNTKITDITAEAGRAAGSFYNHFTGKEDLLKALLADLLAESDEQVADSRHSPDFTDRAAVRWHIEAYWRFYTRHTVELTALRQAALVNAEFGAQVQALMNRDITHIRDHLDPITAAGRTLPGSPDVVLAMFAGLLDGFGSHWQMSGGRLGDRRVDEDEAIDALTDFVYRALNGRPG
ncbi:TetR/AcrR family transcriptional regulator [Mycobacterium malmoense]|uniref:TetR family transcriptional regulator n=1 Tax=Mycobacterium malmoense TaxID=1780 RepID=A0ABX3SQZ0_MYCMA|nr:TetR/AcrR family transcriptional regulator [Mycobacterium malmoense]OIN78593.1 TetR family transcriptional regulator [Mycobacterium malmoense]ORA81801.1 TetR family transcriptional regulator [Mycobacterium malmoense]UNB96144.1 TetR/AcrR family transcriptional regulator [Mycobacterium malmoense]